MRRRDFILRAGSAAASWPLAARAQQPDKMRRIGILAALAADDPEMQTRLAEFRQELEKFGWSDGSNVHVDTRFARPITLASELAKELVALQPDVILAHSTPVTAAIQKESHTIPIVFVAVSDPIGAGFVVSLSRPGGNLTGLALFEPTVSGKWLALLKEISPGLRRVALLANPKVAYAYWLRAAEAEAPALGIELVPSPVENAADIEHAIESFARAPNGGLLVAPDASNSSHHDLIIALAARYRLPAVYSDRNWTEAGGLMSYGAHLVDLFQQAAYYVDRILRGAKPADLPVQAPTKYQTTLNLKTAKILGLDVPSSLLVRADEVIE
jgi:putative tryptophan/tyrosine transport system substrate-binding protein